MYFVKQITFSAMHRFFAVARAVCLLCVWCLFGTESQAKAPSAASKRRAALEVPRLSFVSPTVRTQTARGEWMEALPEQPIERVTRISTGKQGGAEITIGEILRIWIEPDALVYIKKLARGLRGPSEIQLVAGALYVELLDIAEAGQMTVQTPAGPLRLRSGVARIAMDVQGQTMLSVYQGVVSAHRSGQDIKLGAGQGALLVPDSQTLRELALPGTPSWSGRTMQGSPRIELALQPSASSIRQGELQLSFSQVAGAKRYRVELAADPQFHDQRGVAEVLAPPYRALLAPGLYYARLTPIGEADLFGPSSTTQAFYFVVLHGDAAPLDPTAGPRAALRALRADAGTKLSLDAGPMALRWQIDDQERSTCHATSNCVVSLPPGEHDLTLLVGESQLTLSVATPDHEQESSPVPTPYLQAVEPIEVAVAVFSPGAPLRALDPRTRVLALLGIASRSAAQPVDVVRLDLGGEVSFWQRRMSVDLTVPLLYTMRFASVLGTEASGPALGDLSLGGRLVALSGLDGKLRFGTTLRMQIPTGTYERLGQRPFSIEPALALAGNLRRVGFLTSQGLSVVVNLPSTAVRYHMGFAAQVGFWRMALLAQLDAALGMTTGLPHAASLGGGARIYLGDSGAWRLLVGARGGLGSAGMNYFGQYTAQIGVEWAR